MRDLEAVVLAAGGSRRFGAPKALAPWGQTCLLAQVIHTTRQALGDDPWVVLGAAAEEIEAILRAEAVSYRPLPHQLWARGLSASLQHAITHLATQGDPPDGILIVLGDQPAVSAQDLHQLIALWRDRPDYAVAAEYNDQVGAPCVLPRRLFAQVATLHGDQGARALLRAEPRLRRYSLPAAAWDVDTPEDLRAAWSQYGPSRRNECGA